MALFSQLGINSSFLIITPFFLITILILMFVFQKYHLAFLKREEMTTGATQNTTEIQIKIASAQKDYEQKARAAAQELKGIMDQARIAASKEREEKLSKVRNELQLKISKSKASIEDQIKKIDSQLNIEKQTIKSAIFSKMTGGLQ